MEILNKLKKILSTPISTATLNLGGIGRFTIFQLKIWTYCARLLKKNRANQQAAALSYHTIFGLVPLFIVMLMLFQLFPAHTEVGYKIKDSIYNWAILSKITSFESDEQEKSQIQQLIDHIDERITEFFAGAHTGKVTAFSGFLVIWAALALLSTIEKSFNRIWHVAKMRGFLQRMINYWALLTLGVPLIALGIYLTARFSPLGKIMRTFSVITPALVSYIITTIAFFLLYFILPNTKVKAKSAIWGAIVSALVWTLAKSLYGYSVSELKLYNTVYGALALIPITVLWIYITWLIVLFGLQLTFTTQHLQTLDAAEIAAAKKSEDYFIADEFVIIDIVREIASAFELNNAPIEQQVISSKLNIPPEFCEKILNKLIAKGILIKSSEPKIGFLPARDPENIKLSEIADIVAALSFGSQSTDQSPIITRLAQDQKNSLAQYNVKQTITDT